jgi:ABC-2 type transport system ATP-binding protein
MSALALDVRSLFKSYPAGPLHLQRRGVLSDLSFHVQTGEIFGYLGPNGSGKTTTIKVLMGLVFSDAGDISILGHSHRDTAWRSRVGFLPEHPYFYDYLTAPEYLDFVGQLFGMPRPKRRQRARYLLDLVGLSRYERLSMRRFSKGMLQRLGLAQALVNDPELVVLDEPMSGLDPIGRHLVRNLILELKRAGKTIFFSTHILPDAETLCDRVALIRGGRLIESGRIDEILRLDIAHMELLATGLSASAFEQFPAGIRGFRPIGERWRLEVEEAALGAIVGAIEKAGGRILMVQPVRQSLEEHFFEEMGGDKLARWELPE